MHSSTDHKDSPISTLTPPPAPQEPKRRAVAAISLGLTLVAICLIGILAGSRWTDPSTRRPLEEDELRTLEYYTWAGLEPSGDPRPLRRLEDIERLPAPSLRLLAMGAYRSLGVWKEPNNHILNSLLMNFALLRGCPTQATPRIPTFLGALAFAGSVWVFFQFVLRWRYAALLATLWAFSLPYTARFSVEARGYTLMLFLQMLFLAAAYQAARRPTSICWGAAQAITAIASFMNIVSLTLDWLVPAYAAMWFFPPASETTPGHGDHLWHWRRNLTIQILGIAGAGFIFLSDRLPAMIASAQQYGETISSSAEVMMIGKCALDILFPSAVWVIFAGCGLVGIVALALSRENRPWAVLAIAVLLTSVAHFAITKKLPYARVFGYFLPLILTGVAYLVERACRRAKQETRWLPLVIAVGFTGVLVWQAFNYRLHYFDWVARLREIQPEVSARNQDAAYALTFTEHLDKYMPAEWLTDPDPITPDSRIGQCIIIGLPPQIAGIAASATASSCYTATVGPDRLLRVNAQVEAFSSTQRFPGLTPIIILWYPDPKRVGITNQRVQDFVADLGVWCFVRRRRLPAKLDFFSQIYAVELIVRSEEEWEKARKAVETGLSRFGGHALCLVARN